MYKRELHTARARASAIGVYVRVRVAWSQDGSVRAPRHRTLAPHAHMVTLDATNRWAIVADLGTDDVHTYSFDAESGALAPRHRVSLPPGSGPRHMCFHPSGRCESLT